ncbi:uncharacterized protein LOC143692090, partial [Agelaius phoeniceus]|uniref:uncharacterized protein LOC143692090 n=1 Tax=Agelaius phoeniceus TaxID=39638 RepID=UPI0040550A12
NTSAPPRAAALGPRTPEPRPPCTPEPAPPLVPPFVPPGPAPVLSGPVPCAARFRPCPRPLFSGSAPRTAFPRQAGAPRSHRAPCPPEGALRGAGPTRRLRTGERPRSRTRQRPVPAAIPGPKPVPGPLPLPSARRGRGGTARHTPAALCPPPPASVAVAPSHRPVPALRGPAPRTCAGPAPLSPPVPGLSLGSLARRCASPARRLLPPGTARSLGRCGGAVTAARAAGAERCLALPGGPGRCRLSPVAIGTGIAMGREGPGSPEPAEPRPGVTFRVPAPRAGVAGRERQPSAAPSRPAPSGPGSPSPGRDPPRPGDTAAPAPPPAPGTSPPARQRPRGLRHPRSRRGLGPSPRTPAPRAPQRRAPGSSPPAHGHRGEAPRVSRLREEPRPELGLRCRSPRGSA